MSSLKNIAATLKEKNYFLVFGHVDPDGDCLGSIFALKWILDKLNKKSLILLNESPHEKYDLFFITPDNENDYQLFSNFDVQALKWPKVNIIALDAGDSDRLGEGKKIIKDNFVLNIDHHIDNPAYGDLNYINAEMAATGEIIYNLAKLLKITINRKIGTAIATAIIGDTGAFRYENTSPEVLRIIASLMEKEVNIYKINKVLFGNRSFKSIKLKGLALANLKLSKSNKIAWLYVDYNMLKKLNADEGDTDGLVNYARDIRGVEVGICFTYHSDNETRVSFRSNTFCPVNEIAAKFGGGGHPKAAGCTLDKSLKKTMDIVLNEVKKIV